MRIFIATYLVVVAVFSSYLFQDPTLTESIRKGNEIYTDFCVVCHMVQGEGVANTFPPLAKSDYLTKNREASIRAIKYGLRGEIEVNGVKYDNVMAPLGLEDEEIADVMNFILNSWGNTSDKRVTKDEVSAISRE